MNKNIAKVAVGLPVEGPFDYSVDKTLKKKVCLGHRVRVPFHGSRRLGFIVGFAATSSVKTLKPLLSVIDSSPILEENLLQLTKEFSEYYGCSWGEAIETSLPTSLRRMKTLEAKDVRLSGGQGAASALDAETVLLHDKGEKERWEYLNEQIDQAFLNGQGVIFLVPEVIMIDEVVAKLKDHFEVPIAIFDKQLSAKEELKQWVMLKSKQAKIVVGTRSAVFAPVDNLGLIVVYEEENSAYKQEQSPYYHVRDVAAMRSRIDQCRVLLVSCAPSAEVWWLAKKGKIKKVTLESDGPNKIQLIDLSNYNPRKTSVISFPLRNIMEKTLKDNGTVVLYWNLKGKAIDRLEGYVKDYFPTAKVARFDKDTTDIPKGTNVLIATQALLKILGKFPIDIIAVLRLDSELQRLDFRSAQRAFSFLVLLNHFAKQKMILQSRNIDNYFVKAIRKMNFDYFYREEIKLRKELELPPFKHLLAVGIRGKNEQAVADQAQALFDQLTQQKVKNIEILEPQPDIMPKLRDKHRLTIMLKGKSVKKIIALAKKAMKGIRRKHGVFISLNIDP